MSRQERIVIVSVLLVIAVAVALDLLTDSQEGAAVWHLFAEGSIGVAALFGTFYLLRESYLTRRSLELAKQRSSNLLKEAEDWRLRSQKYLEGLSNSIDQQLTAWGLTPAEKEVAFLLLKGMSLKEIAAIRSTAEKTARVQSVAVYAKAGLSGRSDLAAFFLEDLLLPGA
ncbi:MAG: helix-turn-helix transcriptional regulator, partial [Bdellovibrionales bacterium]|nr:helix-turn-helix transcriptional regulator [Bdellovibrionales bacterium]